MSKINIIKKLSKFLTSKPNNEQLYIEIDDTRSIKLDIVTIKKMLKNNYIKYIDVKGV